jgi:hypothetical protein
MTINPSALARYVARFFGSRSRTIAFVTVLVDLLITILVFNFYVPPYHWLWVTYCISLFIGYVFLLRDIAENMTGFPSVDVPWMAFLFFNMTLLIALLFTMPWIAFAHVSLNGKPIVDLGLLDAMYLSVSVLTTLGFGDIVPSDEPSRAFLIYQVLFGVTHMVVSLSVITSRMIDKRISDTPQRAS